MMTDDKIMDKLRWQCRRGMLELDVLLNRFLENRYRDLSTSDQALFVDFLASNDQDLFEWLTGKVTPEKTEYVYMRDLITDNYFKSKS